MQPELVRTVQREQGRQMTQALMGLRGLSMTERRLVDSGLCGGSGKPPFCTA